jgi:hypothetical protein
MIKDYFNVNALRIERMKAAAAASRGFDYVDTSFQYIDEEEEEETLLLADICIQILEEDFGFRVQRGTPHRISPFGYKLIIRLFW